MNTLKTIIECISISFIVGCTSIDGRIIPTPSNNLQDEFFAYDFKASNGIEFKARAYIPSNAVVKSMPLIVYLHGVGQNGIDNIQQLDSAVGSIYAFSHDRDDYKAVIVVPQCPCGVYWRDDNVLIALKEFIQHAASNTLIDNSRIYITGFSMGGDASWKLALNWPDLMTTIIPICGGPLESMEPDIPIVPNGMEKLNIWAFNNFNDGVVRPRYSKRIFSQLWSKNVDDNLNFTENISGGHNSTDVYRNRDILIWMMSTRKRQ